MRNAAALLLCALVGVGPVAGCGSSRSDEGTPTGAGQLDPVISAGDSVVAEVNGRPILASDLRHQMKGGKPRKQALQELIQLEVLVDEARRRGLDREPGAMKARRKAMAERMVKVGFSDGYSPETIPKDMVHMAYKRYLPRYVHPELVRVSHVIFLADAGAKPKHRAAAKAFAQQLHKQATARPMTDEAFRALLEQVDLGDSGVKGKAESLTTDQRGRTVREFADAAFKLSREGQISPVTRSMYGYHVIRLIRRIPPRNERFEQVEGKIRQQIFKATRGAAFSRWANRLAKEGPSSVTLEVLQATLGKEDAEAGAK